jgi:excisionase family DNA binding protein
VETHNERTTIDGNKGALQLLPTRKPQSGEILTRAEVARLLKCSPPHIVALVEREQLPSFRLGKLWRFRRSQVMAWCAGRTNGGSSA